MRYQVVDVPMPTDAGPVYFQSRALFLFMLSPQQNTSTDIDHRASTRKEILSFPPHNVIYQEYVLLRMRLHK